MFCHYLIVHFVVFSCVVLHLQSIVSVCSSIKRIHRLSKVARASLLHYHTVEVPVQLCLE